MIESCNAPRYIGRFAPSPTGPLHFGSLLSALVSYLDARAHQGLWLLRIEDIDPPRAQQGAATAIIETLKNHGLLWHGEVIYQSARRTQHLAIRDALLTSGVAYFCRCSRKMSIDGHYSGCCRLLGLPAATGQSIRLKTEQSALAFQDGLWGFQESDLKPSADDFIIWRKDDWPAYQLAVVIDDALDGVNHVVRGLDLMASTFRQIYLHQALGQAQPVYYHHPVVVGRQGEKLSKQTYALAVD